MSTRMSAQDEISAGASEVSSYAPAQTVAEDNPKHTACEDNSLNASYANLRIHILKCLTGFVLASLASQIIFIYIVISAVR